MASKTLTLNKLVSSDFSEGSSWVLNKGGGGDTDVGYFVFNSLGTSYPKVSSVSFKINAIETGGNNLFAENINLNFEFGKYSGSTFTKASSFSFGQQGVKESQNQVSITATSSSSKGSEEITGGNLCVKLTITPQSNSVGSKIVMSGFSLSVTYEVATCTAIFNNYDGTELQRVSVTKGSTPSYTGATPSPYVQDWQYANVFSGWSPALGAITGNTTYTAQFTPTLRKYVIERSNQNELAKEITISGYGVYSYGDTVTLTAEYQLPIDVSWQIGADNVFKGSPLTFKLDDNTLSKLRYGDISLSNYETLESWIILNVSAYYKTYIVNFNESPENGGDIKQAIYDDNGEIVYWLIEDVMEIQYPKNTLTIDAVPNKGYRFVKWSDGVVDNPRDVTITEDVTFTAIFQKIPPKFTSAEMKYLDKQISSSNKVICNEGFILSVTVT